MYRDENIYMYKCTEMKKKTKCIYIYIHIYIYEREREMHQNSHIYSKTCCIQHTLKHMLAFFPGMK